MATKTKKKQRRIKKTDLSRSFDFTIQPWNGMIVSQDSYTIPEDTAVWISGLPKLSGAIENVPNSSLLYTHTSSVKDFFVFGLGDSKYFCIIDGSNLTIFSSSFTSIASFATTETKVDFAVQDNTRIWITARSFLIVFDGSTITNMTSYDVTGDTICYWKGRIFIGKDRVITFSKPNPDTSSNPFDTAAGGGYITLTVSSFSKILALIPKEDSIYIFTDRSIVGLIGTTISNDPNQWYIAEIVKDIGITGVRNYVVSGHTIYFHTPFGLYSIISTSPEKFDDAITNMTGSIKSISLFSYNQIQYIALSTTSYINNLNNAIYCFNTLLNKWYALEIDCDILSNFITDTYYVKNTKVYKLFSSADYLPLHVKSKIFFNLDNIYYNIKNIIIYGRGSFDYLSQFVTIVFASEQDNIVFQTSAGQLISFAQTQDFWIAVLKPTTTLPYSMRVKQFQIEIRQNSNSYSEIISIKVNGTLGARYV